jgi:hypothetical protein
MTEPFRDIFIARGERLTDRGGATICYAARDILWSDSEHDLRPDDFERWSISPDGEWPFVYDTGLGAPAFWVDGESRFFDRSCAEEDAARAKLGLPPLPTVSQSFP